MAGNQLDDQPSEQEAGAGANNPVRPSETGGNSIEVGDQIEDALSDSPGSDTEATGEGGNGS
ncbi:MAG: hypothetical protein JWQ68_716 [Cryobacterium sp.]|jgi:hypothetical protein|nr:hypothetical protein [Cryobacterium sp.]